MQQPTQNRDLRSLQYGLGAAPMRWIDARLPGIDGAEDPRGYGLTGGTCVSTVSQGGAPGRSACAYTAAHEVRRSDDAGATTRLRSRRAGVLAISAPMCLPAIATPIKTRGCGWR
jgi:hypothetical protein